MLDLSDKFKNIAQATSVNIVLVTARQSDFMAYVSEHPEIWECAPTAEEAVEKLKIRLSV